MKDDRYSYSVNIYVIRCLSGTRRMVRMKMPRPKMLSLVEEEDEEEKL